MTIAVVGGVVWLAFLAVSALRGRGKEEIAPNLAPARTDEELETRRLERFQKGSVILSAFMAVFLPLYFLGEDSRQQSFVTQFDEEQVARGEHIVSEHSHKYSLQEFAAMAEAAGWHLERCWTDDAARFSVNFLRTH